MLSFMVHSQTTLSFSNLRKSLLHFPYIFNPGLPLEQQYAMYGDPFGKSLCHAWAASPIYLLARYYVGLRPDTQAPGGYECHPAEGFFRELDCTLPVGGRTVRIRIRDGKNAEISEE